MTTDTASTITLPKAGTYTIDKAHTIVGFVARHLVGTKVRGQFSEFDGSFTVAEPIEGSSLRAEAQAASINTGVAMRDDHLRTNDFLDAPNYPTLTLVSTGLTKVTASEWELSADLTIRGVTKPVVFELEFLGSGPSMEEGKEVVAFSASTEIDRRDFGVSFNHALFDGSLAVGHKVRIEIEVEASLQA
jgi:polyisoprenoid-binding protein YceI